MQHFNLRMAAQGSHLTFYFNELTVNGTTLYLVSTISKENRTHLFYMTRKQEGWHIVMDEALPNWIYELESVLASGIEEQIMVG
jgi:hypothetical protein